MKPFLYGALAAIIGAAMVVAYVALHSASQANARVDLIQRQLITMQRQQAASSARLAGSRRDVLTCQDLQAMGLQSLNYIDLNTNALGNFYATANQSPVSLPQHCINP